MTQKEELNTTQIIFAYKSKRKQVNKRSAEDLVNLPIIVNNYYQFRSFNKVSFQKQKEENSLYRSRDFYVRVSGQRALFTNPATKGGDRNGHPIPFRLGKH